MMLTNSQKLAKIQAWLGERKFTEYLGIESYGWNVPHFETLLDGMNTKPDSFFVKVGEAGHEWYGGQFPQIREAFLKRGVGCAPYIFCRPQYVARDTELAVHMCQVAGGVVLDCEEQFINNNGPLYTLIDGIRQRVGESPVILVSGYGDPITAVPAWDFAALHNADGYQPQWYVGWWDIYRARGYEAAIAWGDGQCYQRFIGAGLGADYPIQPVMNVEGVAFTDLAPLAALLLRWKAGLSVWEARDITAQERQVFRTVCSKTATS